MSATNLLNRVNDKLDQVIAHANDVFSHRLKAPLTKPKLKFNRGRTAGWALGKDKWTISLNSVLLAEFPDRVVDDTLVHEVAHLIDEVLHPQNFRRDHGTKRIVHGPTWQNIMRQLGVEPSRTHSLDTTNATQSNDQYQYRCNHCGKLMVLGAKRHAKVQNGHMEYWTRGCKNHGGFTFIGKINLSSAKDPSIVRLADEIERLHNRWTAPATKVALAAQAPRTRSGSKIDRCRSIFAANPNISRKDMINLFIAHADCTNAGASTYYQTIRKENS